MIEKNLINIYQPLLEAFVDEIANVDKTGLPEPFIPVCGEQYCTAEVKIAFVGWETRGEKSLNDFCELVKEKDVQSLTRFNEIILPDTVNYPFTTYGNGSGTAFWDFNMKFLGRFHNMDWKGFKNAHVSTLSDNQKRVLESFLWGNIESIERFHVTAKNAGGSIDSWQKVKEASRILDDASIMISVFKPDLIIVEKWTDDDRWIIKNCIYTHEKLSNCIDHYYLPDTETHIYWTYHPLGMSWQGIEQDEIIMSILLSYCEKEPKKLIPVRSRIKALSTMNEHLSKIASNMGLQFFPMKSGGSFSGFYFKKPSWTRFRIGFEFDDEWGCDFFKGIWRDKGKKVSDIESIMKKFCMEETPTEQYPYWEWFRDDCRNWNNEFYDKIHDRLLVLENELSQMLSKMEDLEEQGVEL